VQGKRLEGDGCGLLAEAPLKQPVCFRDIRLGIAIDVIFDASLERALALDVLCGDRNRRFLAYGACEMEPRAARRHPDCRERQARGSCARDGW
jgi:hypothetical protein